MDCSQEHAQKSRMYGGRVENGGKVISHAFDGFMYGALFCEHVTQCFVHDYTPT